ncbi:SAV_2336 N-terminal domain-related protein [Streptomyces sp. NPDC013953]|uniref:SAV_2336 N-terminal domain-related protein n=1 Tax=Streptomyces sp. NPDC013953 TaxID=3364868 RepID=UPI003701DEFA
MIEELLAAFAEDGPDAGAEEIADILWMAARVDAAGSAHRAGSPDPGPSALGADTQAHGPTPHEGPARGQPEEQLFAARDRAGPEADGERRGMPLRVARAATLHEPLALMRSLRPLGRRAIGRSGDRLDEQATVERSTERMLLSPVLLPSESRWLDLALVVDAHHSMLLWADLVEELGHVLTRSGVFRDVRTWFLSGTEAGGTPMVSHRRGAALRSPSEIADPSGHRLVLLLTDTVADGWRGGALHDVLRHWSAHNSVAVLNVLPERLWSRAAVRPVSLLLRSDRPASATRSWRRAAAGRARLRRRRARTTAARASSVVPVVAADPRSLARLARLTAGDAGWHRLACLTLEPWPSPPGSAAGPPRPSAAEPGPERLDALDAVERFRAGASPTAQQLAAYLAAVPLTLPVMTLVRRSLLPASEHGHLAEVALGGLFRPWGGPPPGTSVDDLAFDFLPGVRDVLLGSQRRGDVATVREVVRRSVWEYLERQRGAVREFTATRVTCGTDGRYTVGGEAEPFADRPLPGEHRPTAAGTAEQLGPAPEDGREPGTGPRPDAEPARVPEVAPEAVPEPAPVPEVASEAEPEPLSDGGPAPVRGLSGRLVSVMPPPRAGGGTGAGLLLTPRLLLTCLDEPVTARFFRVRAHALGRTVSGRTVWGGGGRLAGAALVATDDDVLDAREWAHRVPARLRWGAPAAPTPMTVDIGAFSEAGDPVELTGQARLGADADVVELEIATPHPTTGWPELRGAPLSRDGVLTGVVVRWPSGGDRLLALSARTLLDDPGFRETLRRFLSVPGELEEITVGGGERLPAVRPVADAPLCVAVEIRTLPSRSGRAVDPVVPERHVAEALVAVMRGREIDGTVVRRGGPGQPDLLMRIDAPQALRGVGRLLADLPGELAASGLLTHAPLALGFALAAGDAEEVPEGLVGPAVEEAARMALSPEFRSRLRPGRRGGAELLLAVSDSVRRRTVDLLGPSWGRLFTPLGATGADGRPRTWFCEADPGRLGREWAETPSADPGGDDPDVPWTRCGVEPAPANPRGCPGRALPGHWVCFAHLSPAQRSGYLALVVPGASVDFSGTSFTPGLLAELRAALWDPAEGRMRLGRAGFDRAVFHGDCDFRKAEFGEEARFAGALFLDSVRFTDARFRSGVSFASARFSGPLDLAGVRCDGDLLMEHAVFETAMDMSSGHVDGSVMSAYTRFQGPAHFQKCSFRGEASWDYATFDAMSSWQDARFHRRSSFAYASFHGMARFDPALFGDDAAFDYAVCHGGVAFRGARFLRNAGFHDFRYTGALDFRSADFGGETDFSDSRRLPELAASPSGRTPTRPAAGVRAQVGAARAVLFDFDPVLCRLFDGHLRDTLAAGLVRQAGEYGLRGPWPEETDTPHAVLRALARTHPDSALVAGVERYLTQQELDATASAVPTPYAEALIRSWGARDVPLAVMADCSTQAVLRHLSERGLASSFQRHVYGRRPDLQYLKPDPLVLRRALDAMGAPAADTLLISADPATVAAGREAGLSCLGYADDEEPAGRLRSAGAQVVVGSLEPVLAAVRELPGDPPAPRG